MVLESYCTSQHLQNDICITVGSVSAYVCQLLGPVKFAPLQSDQQSGASTGLTCGSELTFARSRAMSVASAMQPCLSAGNKSRPIDVFEYAASLRALVAHSAALRDILQDLTSHAGCTLHKLEVSRLLLSALTLIDLPTGESVLATKVNFSSNTTRMVTAE